MELVHKHLPNIGNEFLTVICNHVHVSHLNFRYITKKKKEVAFDCIRVGVYGCGCGCICVYLAWLRLLFSLPFCAFFFHSISLWFWPNSCIHIYTDHHHCHHSVFRITTQWRRVDENLAIERRKKKESERGNEETLSVRMIS